MIFLFKLSDGKASEKSFDFPQSSNALPKKFQCSPDNDFSIIPSNDLMDVAGSIPTEAKRFRQTCELNYKPDGSN